MINTEEWSLELLTVIDWKRFEELCGAIFEAVGYEVERTPSSCDGGIDLILRGESCPDPIAVQCKRQKNVGVSTVREFWGAIALGGYSRGILLATGQYSASAAACVEGYPNMVLVNGKQFMEGIADLREDEASDLLALTVGGDAFTPTCPSCDIKMKFIRPKPRQDFEPFWGCRNYPKIHKKKTFERKQFPFGKGVGEPDMALPG